MVGKSKTPTSFEKHRMSTIKEQGWCIPCTLNRTPNRPATTIQHVVEGNKRLGHRYTYGCCGWHHLAHLDQGMERFDMQKLFGPSLALGSREYHEVFGTERMLVQLQDHLLRLFEESPWTPYNMPRHVQYEIQQKWNELRYG